MDKIQRNERVAIIIKTLGDNPGKIYTLGYFSDMLNAAKSTISEDIGIVQNLVNRFQMGKVETIPGASGGARYFPYIETGKSMQFLTQLCEKLSGKERIVPGGFVYMLDIIFSPGTVEDIGRILATHFYPLQADYVITVETKGIPIAFTTARFLNVPLVIARRNNEISDGSTVNINYVSGSSKTIQTMALPLRAMKRNSRVLFIDDFMKGGGTAKGIIELVREFESNVDGIGVLVETSSPEKKLVNDYFSLLTLHEIDEASGYINIKPCIKSFG